jgi:ankyrin repeat protein
MNNKFLASIFLCLTCVGIVTNIAVEEVQSEETIEREVISNNSLFWEEIVQQAPSNLEDSKTYYRQTIERYLQLGGDPQAKDNYGWTVLHAAVFCDSKELVQLLINKGVDVDAKASGMTPIDKAIDNEDREIIELLIDGGVDINAKDDRGNTILHKAAYKGNQKIVELLIFIDRGADINARTKDGYTVLHYLAMNGYSEMKLIVELLIAKGADVNAKTNDGKTPLDAIESIFGGDPEIIEIFKQNGAVSSDRTDKI